MFTDHKMHIVVRYVLCNYACRRSMLDVAMDVFMGRDDLRLQLKSVNTEQFVKGQHIILSSYFNLFLCINSWTLINSLF